MKTFKIDKNNTLNINIKHEIDKWIRFKSRIQLYLELIPNYDFTIQEDSYLYEKIKDSLSDFIVILSDYNSDIDRRIDILKEIED